MNPLFLLSGASLIAYPRSLEFLVVCVLLKVTYHMLAR